MKNRQPLGLAVLIMSFVFASQAGVVLNVDYSQFTAGETIDWGQRIEDTSGNGYHGMFGGTSGNSDYWIIKTFNGGVGISTFAKSAGVTYHTPGTDNIPEAWDGPTTTVTPYFTLAADKNYTFESVVKFASIANSDGLMGNTGGNAVWMKVDQGNLKYLFNGSDDSGADAHNWGIDISEAYDDKFHNITLVLDRTGGEIRTYLDGKLKHTNSSIAGSNGQLLDGTTQFFTGGYNYTDENDFTGVMDQFRISDTALTTNQMLEVSEVTPQTTVAVFGSSVAKGSNAEGELIYGSIAQSYAGRMTTLLEPTGTTVFNVSVPGDDTSEALTRFDSDLLPVDPDIVVIGLSLGNEGLASSTDPAGTSETFRSGMTTIIEHCRAHGFYPVAGLVYPNNNYTLEHYEYVKAMNLLMNTWDLPTINFLGAIDDGQGQWADGFWGDDLHPNTIGHEEMFYAFVPSLFDAIAAGKTNSPSLSGTTGYARLAADPSEPAPVSFEPSHTLHSFTTAFRVRSGDTGTVAAICPTNATINYATIELRDEELVYVSPDGLEIAAPVDANDQSWHDVALAHRYAQQETLLFVDGILAGTLTERMAPTRFTLGGPDAAAGRPASPAQADFQDWCVYRAAWTEDEALAQHDGNLQQASMEICAPLNDASFAQGSPATNKAQSLSAATVNTANLTPMTAVTPSDLTARSFTSSSVELTWTDNSTTETGYVIERRLSDGGTWSAVASLAPDSTSYADTGLAADSTYDYRVSSQEGSLQSDYSETVSITTGQDGQSYQEWSGQFFPNAGLYLVDFNSSGNTNYGGVVWNTITSYTDATPYSLVNTNNDSSAGYTLALTDAFDAFRDGNGSPLAEYADDAQSTLFVSRAEYPGTGQITLSGLNDRSSYDFTVFGRRNPVVSGFDYRTVYSFSGDAGTVSVEVDTTDNSTAQQIVGLQPVGGEIVLDVGGPSGAAPTNEFAGISLLAIEAISPADTFLIDFNNLSTPSYPFGQSWNTVTSPTAIAVYDLVNASGDGSDNLTLALTNAFTGSRDGNDSGLGGFAVGAQDTLYVGPAQMTFSGLDTNSTYSFTFLARRSPVFGGFDYTGMYIFTGGGVPVTNITDSAVNTTYSSVRDITPDNSGDITLEIAAGPDAGTDFPVINLIRMTKASANNVAQAGATDDPDGDGIVNLLEYAYGMDPTMADAVPAGFEPAFTDVSANNISFEYIWNKSAVDVVYTVQSRTNLLAGSWQTATGLTETVVSDGGTNQTLQVDRVPGEPALFLRLKLEIP